jgi:hypothetical protein
MGYHDDSQKGYLDLMPLQVSDLFAYPIGRIRELRTERPHVYDKLKEMWKPFHALRPERNTVFMFGYNEDYMLRWNLDMCSMRIEESCVINLPSFLDCLSLDVPEKIAPKALRKRRPKAESDERERRMWYRLSDQFRTRNFRENKEDGYVKGWEGDIVGWEMANEMLSGSVLGINSLSHKNDRVRRGSDRF